MTRSTALRLVPDAPIPGLDMEGFFQTPNVMVAKAIRAKFTAADWCLWAYLQAIEPHGNRMQDLPTPKKIGEAIGLSERQVKRSLSNLERAGVYEYEIVQLRGQNLAGKLAKEICQTKREKKSSAQEKMTDLSSTGQICHRPDKSVTERTNLFDNDKSVLAKTAETLTVQASSVPAILPQIIQIDQIDQIRHTAAPANAAPAPHPDVCVSFFNKEEEEQEAASQVVAEIELAPTPGSVGQLIKDFAQKKSLNQGTKSAALQRRKNHSTTIEWNCPGSPEEKVKFLEWKGDLLVKAGKCFKEEARGFALSWAKKNAEEATLIFEDWRKGRNQPPASVPSSGSVPVVSTAPDFETQTKSWHANLVAVYRQEGEEAFLALEEWHLDWIDHVRTYRPKLLEG